MGGGLLLELMVESLPEKDEGEPLGEKERDKQGEKIEWFTVLEGLRKYAKGHMLLQGASGSGKFTAMARRLLEEAERSSDRQ